MRALRDPKMLDPQSPCRRSAIRALLRMSLVGVALPRFLAAPAQAQVYAGSDENGTIVLSNDRTAETPDLLVEAPPPSPVLALPDAPLAMPIRPPSPEALAPRARQFAPIVRRVAREVAVSPRLLHAVITVESGYDPRAVSPKGAKGLMQLMPDTAQRFGAWNLFDPQQNVRAGGRYLRWLLDDFRGDVRLALAAYNAGEDAVLRYGRRIPPFPETIDYVPRVLANMGSFRG